MTVKPIGMPIVKTVEELSSETTTDWGFSLKIRAVAKPLTKVTVLPVVHCTARGNTKSTVPM